jgi:hypothetical protein
MNEMPLMILLRKTCTSNDTNGKNSRNKNKLLQEYFCNFFSGIPGIKLRTTDSVEDNIGKWYLLRKFYVLSFKIVTLTQQTLLFWGFPKLDYR